MSPLRRFVYALLASAFLLFISAVSVRNWWGERLLTRARVEQKRGNVNGAGDLYRRALGCGKDEAAVELARMAFYRRQWDVAEAFARQAISMNPLQGYVHVLLAYTGAARGTERDSAGVDLVIEECRRALSLEPAKGDLWRSCGDLMLRLYAAEVVNGGDEELLSRYRREVVKAYRQAIRRDRAGARKLVAFLAEASPDVGILLEVAEGEDLPVLTEAVSRLLEAERWEESKDTYWKAAAHSPAPGTYRVAAAGALVRARRGEEAYTILREYLALSPDDAEAVFRAAEIGAGRGKETWEEAKSLYLEAIGLRPENHEWRRRFAVKLYQRGEASEAFAHLEKVLGSRPEDAEAWHYSGRILADRGEDGEARLRLRKALSLRPGNSSYRKALGEL